MGSVGDRTFLMLTRDILKTALSGRDYYLQNSYSLLANATGLNCIAAVILRVCRSEVLPLKTEADGEVQYKTKKTTGTEAQVLSKGK